MEALAIRMMRLVKKAFGEAAGSAGSEAYLEGTLRETHDREQRRGLFSAAGRRRRD